MKIILNKLLSSLQKLDWADFLVIALIVVHVVIYTQLFNYPLAIDNGDGSRDYLVAHLIANGTDYPLFGPPNGVFVGVGNSLIYYYLLSLPLFIYDSVNTIFAVHVLSQIAAYFLVYLITRRLFGRTAGVAAFIFVAFMEHHLIFSRFVWMPLFMTPFLYFSFYSLLRSFQQTSRTWLIIGCFSISLATLIHNAAGANLLVYLPLSIWVGKKIKLQTSSLIKLWAGCLAFISLAYLPNLIKLYSSQQLETSLIQSKNNIPFIETFLSIPTNLQIIYNQLILDRVHTLINPEIKLIYLGSIMIIAVSLIVKLLKEYDFSYVSKLILLFVITLNLTLAVCIFSVAEESHYLEPLQVLVCIFLAGMISPSLNKRILLLPTLTFVFITFIIVNNNFSFFRLLKNPDVTNNSVVLNEATASLSNVINKLKNDNGYPDYKFFNLVGYRSGGNNVYSSILLIPLQKQLNTNLVIIDETKINDYTYRLDSVDDYFFLFCLPEKRRSEQLEECREAFKTGPGQHHSLEKDVYDSNELVIYLATKNTGS